MLDQHTRRAIISSSIRQRASQQWEEESLSPKQMTPSTRDNFLECAPFELMDGSYTCHLDHCIIHATYNPAHTNLDGAGCPPPAQDPILQPDL